MYANCVLLKIVFLESLRGGYYFKLDALISINYQIIIRKLCLKVKTINTNRQNTLANLKINIEQKYIHLVIKRNIYSFIKVQLKGRLYSCKTKIKNYFD